MKLAVWEYLGRNTSGSSLKGANIKNTLKYWYSWVVKIRNTSEATIHPLAIKLTGPMGLGKYNSLEEYCGPHTASSVFLILVWALVSIIA